MEAQGIAVAEAVGLPYALKRVRVNGAMRFLPARLQIHVPPPRLLGSVASNEPLAPPWPRLVISIGRRSVPIALALKQRGQGLRPAYPESESAEASLRPDRGAAA